MTVSFVGTVLFSSDPSVDFSSNSFIELVIAGVVRQEPVDIAGCAVIVNTEALIGTATVWLCPAPRSGRCNYGALWEAVGLRDWGWTSASWVGGCVFGVE